MSSAALGDISTIVQYINDVKNNEDNFFKIVNLLQKDLISAMEEKNVKKKSVSTQTAPKQGGRSFKIWDLQFQPSG